MSHPIGLKKCLHYPIKIDMDGKIDIYCEFGFLEKFCDSCPQSGGIPHKNHKMWSEYFELLSSKDSNIILTDINEKDYISHCNESISGQIKQLLLTEKFDSNQLVCLPNERKNMEIMEEDNQGESYFSSREQTIFLMNRNKDECKRMEIDYGLLFISMDNLYDYHLLFSPDIQEINQNSQLWKCAETYRHPCNTIILVDRYLISKEDDIIKNNLDSLFDSLLPLNLKEAHFKIYIFTEDDSDNTKNERKKGIIQECLKSLRPSYSNPIKTEIILERHPDHDRYLLTNYGLFNSGFGFVLRDSERKQGTSLSFFPITHFSPSSKKNNVYRIVQNLRKRKESRMNTT